MTQRDADRGRRLQDEQRKMMEQAQRSPGVIEALELYQRAVASQRPVTRIIRTSSVSDRTNP